MLGVDLDAGAEPGVQGQVSRAAFERQPHRQALHHLDPVAGRILGRQQRAQPVPGLKLITLP
jgi:hypothetical protein